MEFKQHVAVRTLHTLLAGGLLGLTFLFASQAPAALRCSSYFYEEKSFHADILKQVKTPRFEVTNVLLNFAERHQLPYKWVAVGPEERRVNRLFVAMDYTNTELLNEYLKAFNLETPLSDKGGGTVVLEVAKESRATPEHYVYAMYRRYKTSAEKIYRYGRQDMAWTSYFSSWVRTSAEGNTSGIKGFGHLIEVKEAEKKNVEKFLDNNDLRATCKSDNCIAWSTGIELGRTDKNVPDVERKFLFNELGVARTIAPFEIGRRLLHAANENHTAIIVFVEGVKGTNTFKNEFEKFVSPEPKIPYSSIIKGVEFTNPQIAEALKQIPDGGKVFIPIAAGASPEGFNALIKYAKTLEKGIDVHVLVNGLSATDIRKAVETTEGKLRIHALFLGGNMRELYAEKKVSVIPGNLSDFTRMMRDPKNTHFHYDAILVRVTPEQNGEHSLGPNQDMIRTILRDRPNIKIIAEINENIPFTNGDNRIASDRISSKFISKAELAGPTVVPPNDVDSKIGSYLGALIDSGATLQIGIGNIFSGLAAGLKESKKQELKISTEMFGDALMEIMQSGIATKAEVGFAYGSKSLYQWLNKNPSVKFVDTEYVNSPGRIARTKKFHAVNTALQVNLFGEVNATMGPEGRISSPGGQVEFMSGASRSEGGKAIIAIRSTAKNGTISSVTLDLYSGPITTPHENVTHLVTEYGVADLRGKSETERAISIINVAHPKFRNELAEKAVLRKIIQRTDLNRIHHVEVE